MPRLMSRSVMIGVCAIFALAGALPSVAHAETHIVKMLNKNPDNPSERQVFSPTLLRVQPGDTVRFVPTDKGHNAATVKGAIPEGAESWRSALGKEFEVTLTVEGTYKYICTPHYGMGMVGVIVVGDSNSNLEQVKAKRHPGKARTNFADLLAQVESTP